MKFSTFHIMSQPESASSHQVIEETLVEIDAAERLGFANTWLTEHHGSRYGLGVAPAVLAAAVDWFCGACCSPASSFAVGRRDRHGGSSEPGKSDCRVRLGVFAARVSALRGGFQRTSCASPGDSGYCAAGLARRWLRSCWTVLPVQLGKFSTQTLSAAPSTDCADRSPSRSV
jgi:hypothetical protein